MARLTARSSALVPGILVGDGLADEPPMIWPVAALAVLLLGFVVVYGSTLQSRLEAGRADPAPDDPSSDTGLSH